MTGEQLAIYDMTGIQEFIFSSKKLAENLGASILVQQVLDDMLSQAIQDTFQNKAAYRTQWRQSTDFEILSNKEIRAEVIYSGGGNALVAYRTIDDARAVTGRLSQTLLEKTGNALTFAVAYRSTSFRNFQQEQQELFKTIQERKYQTVHSMPMLGIGITREGETDGLPASDWDKEPDSQRRQYLSKSAKCKRDTFKKDSDFRLSERSFNALRAEHIPDDILDKLKTLENRRFPNEEDFLSVVNKHIGEEQTASYKRLLMKYAQNDKAYFDTLLPDSGQYAFPLQIDQLGQQEGDDDIAVIHIDGNNMGKMLQDALKQSTNFRQAVATIRTFSKTVAQIYKERVMKPLLARLAHAVEDDESVKKVVKVWEHQGKRLLPIRPVVNNGDDVTVICHGKLGIAFAEEFLKELHKQDKIPLGTQSVKLSACAGVAIVNSHFPFYRAYQLAEELCASAKLKAKTLANGQVQIENWLDFHIVQGGITTDLNDVRKKCYQVPEMEAAAVLRYPKQGRVELEYPQYNLLWRPWCVAGKSDAIYQWSKFQKIHHAFTKPVKEKPDDVLWKRSRLKQLRNEMIASERAVNELNREFRSRGFVLPEILGDSEVFKTDPKRGMGLQQTPYFDALELLDRYVKIPEGKEGEV